MVVSGMLQDLERLEERAAEGGPDRWGGLW